ncbi:MAG TPA: hypothetical protein V6C65_30450 [Allocoleopsis sp.]
MLSNSSIDFFVDDQSRAIPSSIATLYLEEIPLIEQPQLVQPSMARVESEHAKDNSQRWIALALTGLCSAGAVLFQQHPDWLAPFAPISSAAAIQQGTGNAYYSNAYYSMVNQAALSAPATPSNLALETTRSIAPSPSATPVNPTQVRTADTTLLEQANQTAQQAANFAQSAHSIDDWGLVARQWRKAVTLVAAIPSSSTHYNVAQQRLHTYQTNLKTAQQKANQPIVEAPMPTTRIQMVNGVVCRPQSTLSATGAIAVTDVKFVPEEGTNTGYIVGCFTNNTNKPVHGLSFTYRATAAAQTDLVQAGSEKIDVPTVAARQTVAFRTRVTLNPLISNINFQTVSWLTDGVTEPQTLATGVDLQR